MLNRVSIKSKVKQISCKLPKISRNPMLWYRIIHSLVLLGMIGFFYYMQTAQQISDSSYEGLKQTAQSQANVLGVFTGFVAAIIVIVLQSQKSTTANRFYRDGAIAVFMCAFLTSFLGSFQYASYAGFVADWELLIKKFPEVFFNSQAAVMDPVAYKLLTGYITSPLQMSDAYTINQYDVYPNYILVLMGLAYFLSIYLGFYGLILAVKCAEIKQSALPIFGLYMLLTVFLVGTLWVFTDFTFCLTNDMILPYILCVSVYIFSNFIAVWFSSKIFRTNKGMTFISLYIGLGLCVISLVLGDIAYAFLDNPSIAFVEHYYTTMVTLTMYAFTVMLSAIFFFLTSFLHQLVYDVNGDPKRIPPRQFGTYW